MMNRGYIKIEEFELPKPDNFEDLIRNTDKLFAELLIRYYANKKNVLTTVIDKYRIKENRKKD